ncbi:hypothetical protein H3V53_07605 [Paraburkholderia bengalensis]|uniref:Uncharacterized protein n=1 Tax=Paraburkholderia bengalensis TaxID=2747562 RepID=A0ABU8INS7_9BURK
MATHSLKLHIDESHTAACFFSENYHPISTLMERGKNFIRETTPVKPEAVTYYALAEEFFKTVQSALNTIPLAPE